MDSLILVVSVFVYLFICLETGLPLSCSFRFVFTSLTPSDIVFMSAFGRSRVIYNIHACEEPTGSCPARLEMDSTASVCRPKRPFFWRVSTSHRNERGTTFEHERQNPGQKQSAEAHCAECCCGLIKNLTETIKAKGTETGFEKAKGTAFKATLLFFEQAKKSQRRELSVSIVK